MKATCTALLGLLLVAGCGSSSRDDADHVARLDTHHTLVAPLTVGNLTVWPVRTDRPLEVGEFLTLEEALEKGVAEVREVGVAAPQEGAASQRRVRVQQAEMGNDSEVQVLDQNLRGDAAVVNTLVVENRGDLPILVCAGTVVKGGKQDRQIGQDIVLKGKTTTPVDAFCVEQGRWRAQRAGADTGGKFQVLEGMATAKVRMKGQYENDQSGVWQEVAHVKKATVAAAALDDVTNSSFAVAFDANAKREDLARYEQEVLAHLRAAEGAVGFAYAINGKPVAVRTFAHPRLLRKHLDDFARGMAAEALLTPAPEGAAPAARAEDVVALVKRISAADEELKRTEALNVNGLRTADVGFNGNCYVEDEKGRRVALTQDWTAK